MEFCGDLEGSSEIIDGSSAISKDNVQQWTEKS